MEVLFHKLGKPPYRFDQITPLLDEAASLTTNPENTSAQHQDSAIHIIESVEALAGIVEFDLSEAFPQFNIEPSEAVIEQLGPHKGSYVPPAEFELLHAIAPKTLHLKEWLFDSPELLSKNHRPEAGNAHLCRHCEWSFQRLARVPIEIDDAREFLHFQTVTSPHCLLVLDHWPNFPILEKRALLGCGFCRLLREYLPSLHGIFPEDSDQKSFYVWIDFFWDLDTMALQSVNVSLRGLSRFCGDSATPSCSGELNFTVETTNDNLANELGIFRSPATNSLHAANLAFIRRQLSSTEKSATSTRYRPKRLLDIGFSQDPEPKLIDGQQAEEDLNGFRYAALSYCWGSAKECQSQLKLTSETRSEFFSSIPYRSMTPVLHDAITVCQALSARYLWVDSLCIQQDDDSRDWEEQSLEMSHIFGNSWLTICTPVSNSCLEGFLDHVDRHSRTIEIEIFSETSKKVFGSISLRLATLNGRPGFHNSRWITVQAPLARDLLHSKWNNRGWVFQEKIISPRLLYFGARMIHFQQGNRVISEDGCPIEGDIFDSSFYVPHHYSTNLLHQLEMLQSKESIIIDFWYRLVKDFSNSNFTNVRDTFPAIAGIARSIQEFTKHQYLAGLWEEDLCCGLLWNTSREINVGKRRCAPVSLRQTLQALTKPAVFIAPSWSWASGRLFGRFMITNQINLTCRVRSHLCADFDLVESRVSVDGVNPYGRIRSASISLFGPMIRIKPGSMPSVDRQGNRLWVCELFPDCLAILQPDWTPIEPHRTTGIGKRMQAQVQLLLISSCCSDQRIRSSSRDVHTPPRDDLAKLATEPATEPAHYFHTHASYGKKMTSEEMETIENEAMKPEYRNCFYEDSYDGFDTATHCDLCSDRDLRRDIWGLMTYPAGPQDTYYRVGTFFSRAEHGGSAIFKGIEPRKITLV